MYGAFRLLCLFAGVFCLKPGQIQTITDTSYYIHITYGFIIPQYFVIEPFNYSNPYGVLSDFGSLSKSHNRCKVFNTWWTTGFRAGYYSFDNP